MIWERITYSAAVEGGGSRRTTVTLEDPVEHVNPANGTRTISGMVVDRDGDLTGTQQVILLTADEPVKRVRLVQDLHYGGLVTEGRESKQSRAMRLR
jgi:hypothetical protein